MSNVEFEKMVLDKLDSIEKIVKGLDELNRNIRDLIIELQKSREKKD